MKSRFKYLSSVFFLFTFSIFITGTINGQLVFCGHRSGSDTLTGSKDCFTYSPGGSGLEPFHSLPSPTCNGPDNFVQLGDEYWLIGGKLHGMYD